MTPEMPPLVTATKKETLNFEPDPKQTEKGQKEDQEEQRAKEAGDAEQAKSSAEADQLLDQSSQQESTETTKPNSTETPEKKAKAHQQGNSAENPNNLSSSTRAGLGHLQRIYELLAEIFGKMSVKTDGDDEVEAGIKLQGIENQSISPQNLLKKYREQISPPYQGLEIGNLKLNDQDIGTSLGTKKCATYACKLLGIEPPLPIAQDLYFKLYNETKNEGKGSDNLITDWNQLKDGDVVFFHSTYDNGRTITHTGVIIDDNFTMRHHPTAKKGIEDIQLSTTNYWQKHFYAAIRPARSQKTGNDAIV